MLGAGPGSIAHHGVFMNQRSFGVAALSVGALLVGMLAGGATRVPSVHAKAAPIASQQPAGDSHGPAQVPEKKKPPTPCKTTKDCPQDHLCTQVNDHKECTPSAIRVPVAPVVT